MKKLVVLIVAVLAITGALAAARVVNAQIRFGENTAAPSSHVGNASPGTIVRGYYRALNSKSVSLAIPFLSDTVVLQISQPYGNGALEYAGIPAVQHYLEGDTRQINSLTIQEMTVNGDRVEYTVAEWLDPRNVGPTGPFPRINRYVALVRDGKIYSIVQYPQD